MSLTKSDLFDFGAGQATPEAVERLRRQLEDPNSDLSRLFRECRERAQTFVEEPTRAEILRLLRSPDVEDVVDADDLGDADDDDDQG